MLKLDYNIEGSVSSIDLGHVENIGNLGTKKSNNNSCFLSIHLLAFTCFPIVFLHVQLPGTRALVSNTVSFSQTWDIKKQIISQEINKTMYRNIKV